MNEEIKILSVAAGFFINEGKIFIAKRKNNSDDGGKWEFPGGLLKDEESFEDALKREFKEEFNIDIEVIQEVGGAEFQKNDDMYVINFFLIKGDVSSLKLNVHDEYRFVSFEELLKLDLCNPDREFIKNFEPEIKKLLQ